MSTPTPTPPAAAEPKVAMEFFVRVNDMIAMANRIGKRYSTSHSQLVMMHAVARYSSYHYRTTVKSDSAVERQKFAIYMGNLLTRLIAHHMEEVVGPLGGDAPAEGDASAGAPDVAGSSDALANAPDIGSTSAE